MLDKLVKRFETKSEAQLIRLLRISLANAKKDSFKERIRAKIIQQAVLANASNFKNINSTDSNEKIQVDEEELNELAFQEALKELDNKIHSSEKELRYYSSGLKKTLSRFDKDYGWEPFD